MTDFNKEVDINKTIETKLNGKTLILYDLYYYDGPLTMQYLPFGGIQSIYNYQLVIHCKNGYIASKDITYDNYKITIKELYEMFPNIVNMVLPN